MKKFLKSPWGICLGGAAISFIFSLIHDCISGQQVFSTIRSLFGWVYNCVIGCLTATFQIAVWQVILGIFVIVSLRIVIKKARQQKETKPNDSPQFLTYTMDRFQHWKWSWIWEKNLYENAWQVKKLQAHCPKCDTIMLHDGYGSFWCPRCAFRPDYDDCDAIHDVEAVIYDNVKRELYKM